MPRSIDLRSDRGATLVEYSLLVALISVVSIGALSLLSDSSAAAFEDASETVSGGDVSSGESGPSDPGPSGPGPSGPGPSDPGPSGPGPSGDDEVEEPEEPTTVNSSFPTSSASRQGNSHNWTAHADLLISGSDGQPLAGSAAVEVKVIEQGRNLFGRHVENVSTRTVHISNGTGSISDSARDGKANWAHHSISSISYQVIGVSSTSGGTEVEWDGTAPTITVLAP